MPKTQRSALLRNRYFLIADIIITIFAAILSFVLRLEFDGFTSAVWNGLLLFIFVAGFIRISIFIVFGMYARYWKNAGPNELILVAEANAVCSIIIIVSVLLLQVDNRSTVFIPRSIPFIDSLVAVILVTGLRFAPRASLYILRRKSSPRKDVNSTINRVFIIGAGLTGVHVRQVLESKPDQFDVVGFLDDDKNKIGSYVRGVRVFGKISQLQELVPRHSVNQVIIAMPSARGTLIRQIAADCRKIGVDYKIVPGIAEVVHGDITISKLRPVSIDDLLRRAPINLDISDIRRQIENRCVLVTGAGGSIGSEIVRQIAQYNPAMILLLGHGENSLFASEGKLTQEFPYIKYKLLLADIRDIEAMTRHFELDRPHIVFHAAAHKHVPMLQTNISEAVRNNVVGTHNMISLCNKFNVERMVMISTDKAVAPTNIMGMTKRTAELLIMKAAQENPKRFVVVRFGNVLGSRGSVVPLFQEQIARGGPVTITSDAINRFFMSIPEAVLLVLKASVLTDRGTLFVLNMGNPVKIIDLARDLIILNGLEPGKDIEIKITQLRPGEKLFEELFWDYEDRTAIENGTIFAVNTNTDQLRKLIDSAHPNIQKLIALAANFDDPAIAELLPKIVFDSQPAPELSEILSAQAEATQALPNVAAVHSRTDLPVLQRNVSGTPAFGTTGD